MEQVLKSMTLEFFGKGLHKTIPEKLFSMDAAVFLDVRTDEEFASLAFPMSVHKNIQSLHIPIDEIPDRVAEIPTDKMVGIFCPASVRASIVYAYLRTKGYDNVRVLEGGYAALTDSLKPGKLIAVL